MSNKEYIKAQARILRLITIVHHCDEQEAVRLWIESGRAFNFAKLMGHDK